MVTEEMVVNSILVMIQGRINDKYGLETSGFNWVIEFISDNFVF